MTIHHEERGQAPERLPSANVRTCPLLHTAVSKEDRGTITLNGSAYGKPSTGQWVRETITRRPERINVGRSGLDRCSRVCRIDFPHPHSRRNLGRCQVFDGSVLRRGGPRTSTVGVRGLFVDRRKSPRPAWWLAPLKRANHHALRICSRRRAPNTADTAVAHEDRDCCATAVSAVLDFTPSEQTLRTPWASGGSLRAVPRFREDS